ncbi:cupin domain-containing protein [Candidatus Woesebacteria bacterium]|nr:cupin domain-containing protein [Candidatus Woesebacteria bacterium]
MQGIVIPIEQKTEQNEFFREVLFTTDSMQLVVMSLHPSEDIGLETHGDVDQFLRVETGEVTVFLDGQEQTAKAGDSIIVPAGVAHNVVNRSSESKAKLYTIYTPPQHRDGTIHKTKAEAMLDEEDHA